MRLLILMLPILLAACVGTPVSVSAHRTVHSHVHHRVKAVPLPKPAVRKVEKPKQIVTQTRKENPMNIPWGLIFSGDALIVLGTLVVWERLGVRSTVLKAAAKVPFLNKLFGLA